MARSGVSKFHVQQARDALMSKGQNPSLDAIRAALGNTGSKSTIHRYMKELDDAEGTRLDDQALLSDTLAEMIKRIANQLHAEARSIIDRNEASHRSALQALNDRFASTEDALQKCTAELAKCRADLEASYQQRSVTDEAFRREQMRAGRLEQEVLGLQRQLDAAERHQTSLEEKHNHAREALEHYRQAVKDQKDHDERRHELHVQHLQAELRQSQQTIVIKQCEITEITKDNARLATQLGSARKEQSLFERDHKAALVSILREQESRIIAEQRLADAQRQIDRLSAELDASQSKQENWEATRSALEKESEKLMARLEAQEILIDQLKLAVGRDFQIAGNGYKEL